MSTVIVIFQAFYEMILMDVGIVACIFTFLPINALAGYLMFPYLVWVTFASVLTFNIMRMNDKPAKGSKKKNKST